MQFIGRGVEDDERHCGSGQPPVPWPRIALQRFANGTPEQHRENRIFRQMSAFADECDGAVQVDFRDVRKQPLNERADDPGRSIEGLTVSGCGKNKEHPDNHWQPIFQKGAGVWHGGEKNRDSIGMANLIVVRHDGWIYLCPAAMPKTARGFSHVETRR